MPEGALLVCREVLSGPFSESRDDGVPGVLPAVCGAPVLEVFTPVIATGRAATPDPGMASHEAGGRLITGGICSPGLGCFERKRDDSRSNLIYQ